MEKEISCTSCNTRVTNFPGSVTFTCPKCSNASITRCAHCRKIVAKYECPSCKFSGPN